LQIIGTLRRRTENRETECRTDNLKFGDLHALPLLCGSTVDLLLSMAGR
jgi:hypothetical protein